MPDPTREAAFDLLSAVLDRRRPLEEALDALPSLAPRDRAAAHRLAAAVLRRMGTLDAVLEPLLRREPPDPVRHVLRIGAAGLLLLDTPSHAAVATAVALARARGLAPFTGLVNAVLRRIAAGRCHRIGGPRRSEAGYARLALGLLGRQRPRHRARAPARGAVGYHAASRCGGARRWRTVADRIRALPARHQGDGASRLRGWIVLGAGRRRRSAGASVERSTRRASGRPVCRARR